MLDVLLICKNRMTDDGYSVSSGLLNSARMVAEALRQEGLGAAVVSVEDGNYIDRVVTRFRPRVVVLEALWVTPEKVAELARLHPNVQFAVRAHSKTPFLANEGVAIQWLAHIGNMHHGLPNVHVAANSGALVHDLGVALGVSTLYLPNIYTGRRAFVLRHHSGDDLHIGCFGAIRPLKNQLIQAVAALSYADRTGRELYFHINVSRNEMRGQEVLKNLRAMFDIQTRHRLVEHQWVEHDDFLALVRGMDLGLQVSYTETFNIVAADFVSQGVPILVSPDIEWMPRVCRVDPNSTVGMVRRLGRLEHWGGRIRHFAWRALERHNRLALRAWVEFLREGK